MITKTKAAFFAAFFVVMLFPISGVQNAQADGTVSITAKTTVLSSCGLRTIDGLDFMSMEVNAIADADKALSITNEGRATGTLSVIAEHWFNDEGEEVMNGSQTVFATSDQGTDDGQGSLIFTDVDYTDMTPVSSYGNMMGAQDDIDVVTPIDIEEIPPFSTTTIGWKVHTVLSDGYEDTIGVITQKMTFEIEC